MMINKKIDGEKNVRFMEVNMEHLIYFQKLIAKLNSKYTVDSINHFIKEYYADILEEQYAMDKVAEKIVNREEFLKRYFEPEFFYR